MSAEARTQADAQPAVRRRPHAKLNAAIELLKTAELRELCDKPQPALLRRGIAEFNHRRFFEQHETLEDLWRAQPAPIRYLCQGILQIGVGFYHVERGNFHGAVVKIENGLALLEAFEPECMRIDISRLRREAAACLESVLVLGPSKLQELGPETIPAIHLKRRKRK